MTEFYVLVTAALAPIVILAALLWSRGRALPIWAILLLAIPYMLAVMAALQVYGLPGNGPVVIAALAGVLGVQILLGFRFIHFIRSPRRRFFSSRRSADSEPRESVVDRQAPEEPVNEGIIYYRLPGDVALHSWPYATARHDVALASLLNQHPDADIEEDLNKDLDAPAIAPKESPSVKETPSPSERYPAAGVFRGPEVPGCIIRSNLGLVVAEHHKSPDAVGQGEEPYEAATRALMREVRDRGGTHVVRAEIQPVMSEGVVIGYLLSGEAVHAEPSPQTNPA
ncbi:hypothetical protein [Thioalkalivibrio sp. ALMg13-2]|uniref:hypothetical protein n=1 Tax=Thioalkalivibrio sp. ALMg13-2 TaxID=1158167 RepID=UPI000362F65D|nr:hypothetical protein [Thioalkalivibrio sp. ALMg13-2]